MAIYLSTYRNNIHVVYTPHSVPVPYPTPPAFVAARASVSSTGLALEARRDLFRGFLREGYGYKKCGVALLDLSRLENLQHDLFQAPSFGYEVLMSTLYAINRKFGRNTSGFAASGWKVSPAWGMRQKNISPLYTTRWSELPQAKCFQ